MKGLIVSMPQSPLLLSHKQFVSKSCNPLPQRQRHTPLISLSSLSPSPPPSSLVDDDDDPDALPFSGCKACGKEQIEGGCNGEGRIQGGIATFPGFGWWPIKAYRPCPGFLASGGNYRRRGQSMDEVAFGGGKGGKST